jgi:hypothetical protein
VEAELEQTRLATVLGAVRAAARTWRSTFWATTVAVGVVSVLWQIPTLALQKIAPAKMTLAQQLITDVVSALWWSPVLAGQLAFCLSVCRGGSPAVGSFLTGLRRVGPLAATSAIYWCWSSLVAALPSTSGDALAWRDALWALVALVSLYAFVRLSFTPVVIVDLHLGVAAAVRRSWALTRKRSWRIVRFGALMILAWIVLFAVSFKRVALAGALFSLSVGPLLTLSYVNLYLGLPFEPAAKDGDDAAP